MRISRVLVAGGVALAGIGHVSGVLLDNPPLALSGGAVALLLLALWAAIVARHRGPLVRWPLVAGLLVFAGATATGLVWDVSAQRSQAFGWFSYEPLRQLPPPDLTYPRWEAALALLGCSCIAVTVARLPGRRDNAGAVTVSALVGVLLLTYGALDVWSVSDMTAATMAQALPAFAVAAVALSAAVVVARRAGSGAAFVWVGMALLAVPALRGAADVVSLVASAPLPGAGNDVATSAATVAAPSADSSYALQPVPPFGPSGYPAFGFHAFFAMVRLVALAMITVGAAGQWQVPPPRPDDAMSMGPVNTKPS